MRTIVLFELLDIHARDIGSLIENLTGCRIVQTHQGFTQRGLTAAGLSYDTDSLAFFNVESNIVNGVEHSSGGGKILLQIFYFNQICHLFSLLPFRCIAEALHPVSRLDVDNPGILL